MPTHFDPAGTTYRTTQIKSEEVSYHRSDLQPLISNSLSWLAQTCFPEKLSFSVHFNLISLYFHPPRYNYLWQKSIPLVPKG